MKKATTLFLFLFYFCSWAQESSMVICFNDGETLSLPISTIESLTFDELTSIEDIETAQIVINSFTLLQNYPNPFNLSTNISFTLPDGGDAEVSIYNVNGRLVKTLCSGPLSEGPHKLTWTGQDNNGNIVSTGVYFYQINFKNVTIAKKMILVK